MRIAKLPQRILVAGGINFDIIASMNRMPTEHEKLRCGEYLTAAGGSASNTARRIAQRGISTHLLSAVGADAFGDSCLKRLSDAGVEIGYVARKPNRRTGLAVVFSGGSSKRMITFAGPSRDDCYDGIQNDDISKFTHLHVTGEPTEALVRLVDRFADCDGTISIEWNGYDMSEPARRASLNFMNSDELRQVYPLSTEIDEAATSLARQIGGNVLITLGEKGALWAEPGGEITWQATTRVEPVDRTGGGDAFDAGVIVAFLKRATKVDCLRAGLDAAIEAITTSGE